MKKDITEDTLDIDFSSSAEDEITFHLQTETDYNSPRATEQGTTRFTRFGSLNGKTISNFLSSSGSTPVPNKTATIEELSLNPGAERMIVVWYSPRREPGLPDSKSARLQPRSFRLQLRYKSSSSSKLKGKKTIKVNSQVCTSLVRVQPIEINLGECNIGTSTSAVVHLTNLSDLPAHVNVRYESKVPLYSLFSFILCFC